MKDILNIVFSGQDLSRQQARSAMDIIMTGQFVPEQVAAFLGALRAKGESVAEICGFVDSMSAHAVSLPLKREDLIDTCGTGGDGAKTFNISTVSSFVIAASGLGVCKHGNRSVSSQCGSADVLEQLGINIELSAVMVAKSIDEIGFGFLFARKMHPLMRHVAALRGAIGLRTVFNILGPLTNPAGVKRQVIGVYDKALLEKMAHSLCQLGCEEVLLVHGEDGLDEVTLTGGTFVAHVKAGKVAYETISPADFGLTPCHPQDLAGGDAKENADILIGILNGDLTGPKRDIVVMNAACALVVGGKAKDFRSAKRLAESLIDQKRAIDILKKAKEY